MPSFPFPKNVDLILADCVDAVSQRILAQLQVAGGNMGDGSPRIKQITFMAGHPAEIKETLKEWTDGKSTKHKKFPIVMLFMDIISGPSIVRGAFQDVTLNIVIANATEPTYKVNERIAKNFDPILRPIYQELIQQIFRCGYFHVQSVRQILGRDIERFFWGREGIQGGAASEFNDCIDAIEIKGLRLTQARPGTSIAQNTFTQFMEYFLDQARATIIVGSVAGNAITNNFFLNLITQIVAETATYVAGRDFTQTLDINGKPTGEIVGINIEFYTGQEIVAWR